MSHPSVFGGDAPVPRARLPPSHTRGFAPRCRAWSSSRCVDAASAGRRPTDVIGRRPRGHLLVGVQTRRSGPSDAIQREVQSEVGGFDPPRGILAVPYAIRPRGCGWVSYPPAVSPDGAVCHTAPGDRWVLEDPPAVSPDGAVGHTAPWRTADEMSLASADTSVRPPFEPLILLTALLTCPSPVLHLASTPHTSRPFLRSFSPSTPLPPFALTRVADRGGLWRETHTWGL